MSIPLQEIVTYIRNLCYIVNPCSRWWTQFEICICCQKFFFLMRHMLPNYRWKIYSFRCDFSSIKKPCCLKLISLATRNLNNYHLPPRPPQKKKNQMPRERKKKVHGGGVFSSFIPLYPITTKGWMQEVEYSQIHPRWLSGRLNDHNTLISKFDNQKCEK